MLKELVQFVQQLPEELKTRNVRPKEGLHIMISPELGDDGIWQIDPAQIQYERYTKKKKKLSSLMEAFTRLQHNAWMVHPNKTFDPAKGIHTCSPYAVGFTTEFFEGGGKNSSKREKNKENIPIRLNDYFTKAIGLLDENPTDQELAKVFKAFFTQTDSDNSYESVFLSISAELNTRFTDLEKELEELKGQQDNAKSKSEKDHIKNLITEKINLQEDCKPLDGDYVVFYFGVEIPKYQQVYEKYLADKLFNTDPEKPDGNGVIRGTNNFLNGFNSKKPFLLHQTATFDITGRITDREAKALHELKQVLARNILPNPLPIFIFEEELQEKSIGLYRQNEQRLGHQEVIKNLIETHKSDLSDYYLLYYANTKDGLVIKDFDFVPKFRYKLEDEKGQPWKVKRLFGTEFKSISPSIDVLNVFELQTKVLHTIFNNNLVIKTKSDSWIYKYFDDIEEQYCKSSQNYLLIQKYRNAFYDFIYKSKREAVSKSMFDNIMSISILEDIRLDKFENNQHSEIYSIIQKMNIWFSLADKFFDDGFSNFNSHNMASQLGKYQEFVADLIAGHDIQERDSNQTFAFCSGQLIDYLLSQSETSNRSYQRLEPYLQQVYTKNFKQAIANDIARYKHNLEEYSTQRFERLAKYVLTYEYDGNIKDLLPEILAGVFDENYLYKKSNSKSSEALNS